MKAMVTSKGQVTIPKLIRDMAHIHAGTHLDFHLESNGTLIVRPLVHDIFEIKGMIKSKRRRPVSIKEMKQSIQKGAQESMK